MRLISELRIYLGESLTSETEVCSYEETRYERLRQTAVSFKIKNGHDDLTIVWGRADKKDLK